MPTGIIIDTGKLVSNFLRTVTSMYELDFTIDDFLDQCFDILNHEQNIKDFLHGCFICVPSESLIARQLSSEQYEKYLHALHRLMEELYWHLKNLNLYHDFDGTLNMVYFGRLPTNEILLANQRPL